MPSSLSLSSFVPAGASFLHSKALFRPIVLSLRRAKPGGKQATKGSCANRAQLAHVKELAGAPPDPSTFGHELPDPYSGPSRRESLEPRVELACPV